MWHRFVKVLFQKVVKGKQVLAAVSLRNPKLQSRNGSPMLNKGLVYSIRYPFSYLNGGHPYLTRTQAATPATQNHHACHRSAVNVHMQNK